MMDNEKIIRKKVFVYGAVQGVGFRYRAEHAANMLGVTGWVRNEPGRMRSQERTSRSAKKAGE